jgi:hypothetical protein
MIFGFKGFHSFYALNGGCVGGRERISWSTQSDVRFKPIYFIAHYKSFRLFCNKFEQKCTTLY